MHYTWDTSADQLFVSFISKPEYGNLNVKDKKKHRKVKPNTLNMGCLILDESVLRKGTKSVLRCAPIKTNEWSDLNP